jgi:hypothetical protein
MKMKGGEYEVNAIRDNLFCGLLKAAARTTAVGTSIGYRFGEQKATAWP